MKHALIVDDTKNIRTLLTTCLEVYGYEVSAASSGEDALELFSANNFDIAFLDIKMPEISGTEVLKRIRASGINTPVIIMTAFATVKNAVDCTKLGAVAYLQKPFTADKIKSVLSELESSAAETENIITYIDSGKKLLKEGNADGALMYLKKALSINPEYEECYSLIGKVYELKGDLKRAEKFYLIYNTFNKNKE